MVRPPKPTLTTFSGGSWSPRGKVPQSGRQGRQHAVHHEKNNGFHVHRNRLRFNHWALFGAQGPNCSVGVTSMFMWQLGSSNGFSERPKQKRTCPPVLGSHA